VGARTRFPGTTGARDVLARERSPWQWTPCSRRKRPLWEALLPAALSGKEEADSPYDCAAGLTFSCRAHGVKQSMCSSPSRERAYALRVLVQNVCTTSHTGTVPW